MFLNYGMMNCEIFDNSLYFGIQKFRRSRGYVRNRKYIGNYFFIREQ